MPPNQFSYFILVLYVSLSLACLPQAPMPDSDQDSIEQHSEALPNNALEIKDSDQDGIDDNIDSHPLQSASWSLPVWQSTTGVSWQAHLIRCDNCAQFW